MQPSIASIFKMLRPIAAAILSYALVWGGAAVAADQMAWTTGAKFQQRLTEPVDVLWSGNPLRAALRGLAESQQVAILLDRRIDPGQKLDLTIKGQPLGAALQTIAQRCGLGLSRLGAVVYLGPPSTAPRLRPSAAAFARAVRRLPTAMQRKFFQSKALVWQDLSTPRDLLAQLGQQNGVEIDGLQRVPHDLWAAADLPPLSLVDRLSLIAFQFDLTFEVDPDGSRLLLVPLPDNLPEAPDDRGWPVESHSGAKPSPAEPAASVDRIRIQRLSVQAEPLGPVLRQLAARLGLDLRIDETALQAAGISLDQRVTVKVENATVDELFRRLLQSTGLKCRRRQHVVEIVPAE